VAVINDHVGNSHRHGLPCDEREWSLAGRPCRKRDKQAELPVKVCPSCFCTVASTVADCPECGHHWEPPRRELVTVSGSLQEIKQPGKFKQGDSVAYKGKGPCTVAAIFPEKNAAFLLTITGNDFTHQDCYISDLDHWDHFVAKQKEEAKSLEQRKQVAKARTREELEALRLERGYSRGWTDHILRARAKHGRV
jgi:hypothetical protein